MSNVYPPAVAATSSPITRSGTKLLRSNGKPFRVVGVNWYNMAASSIYTYGNGGLATPSTQLGSTMDTLIGQIGQTPVVRFWCFQSYAASGGDWTALDRVFSTAQAKGIYLIPVLENGLAEATQGGIKDDTWFTTGYQSAYGTYTLSFRAWVAAVCARYASNPNILAWEIINEPEATHSILLAFVTDMAARIKAVTSQMVMIGVQGRKEIGNIGAEYYALHNLANVDICSYHDYGMHSTPLNASDPVSGWGARAVSFDNSYGNYSTHDGGTLSAGFWTEYRGYTMANTTRLGFYFYPDPSSQGTVYIGPLTIGTREINFEDGLTGGGVSDGGGTLANTTTNPYLGKTRSVSFTVTGFDFNSNVYFPITSADWDKPFVIRVFAPTAAAAGTVASGLASRLTQARSLNKPLIVDEFGMLGPGWHGTGEMEYPLPERAKYMDRKLGSYLGNGAMGALAWDWEPATRTPVDWAIMSGDPVLDVLKKYAQLPS